MQSVSSVLSSGLVALHHGSEGVAAHYVVGELERVLQYSEPDDQPYLFNRALVLGSRGFKLETPDISHEGLADQLALVGMSEDEMREAIRELSGQYREEIDWCRSVLKSNDQKVVWDKIAPFYG